MKVMIGAFGTRGDVQPMLALAQLLVKRGHTITLCVPPNFVDWARGLGLEPHGIGINFEEFIADHGENVLTALPTVRREIGLQIDSMLPLAQDIDVFLSAALCPASSIFSEKFGKPGRYVMFTPSLLASDDYPAALVPWQHLPRWLNRLSWRFDAALWNLCLLRALNQVRKRLGVTPAVDLWSSVLGHDSIIASESLLAAPVGDANIQFEQTGPWFFDDPQKMPADVEAFLAAGPPPIFIGFGSMTDSRRDQTMARLLEAIRLADVRAIIARGWAGFELASPPPNVLVVGPTPHAQVFPRCAAVVHHGGAGTLHQALRAGVPQIPVPHLLDQFFWSERLERAGLSAGKQSRKHLNPKRLAQAMRRCIDDQPLRARCRDFAAGMTRDGVEKTVRIIEAL